MQLSDAFPARIGRLRYLAEIVVASVIVKIAQAGGQLSTPRALVGWFGVMLAISALVRRIRDMGWNTNWAILPFATLLLSALVIAAAPEGIRGIVGLGAGLVSLGFFIALLVIPTKRPKDEAAQA